MNKVTLFPLKDITTASVCDLVDIQIKVLSRSNKKVTSKGYVTEIQIADELSVVNLDAWERFAGVLENDNIIC